MLTDNLNLGLYLFKVFDKASNKLIYSRGFASIFGEWQSTGETGWSTFHESLRFPWPKLPVTLTIEKRDAANNFVSVWSTEIDPLARNVNRAPLTNTMKSFTYIENGPSSKKVDIVILGDGYTAQEMDKFHKDVAMLTMSFLVLNPLNRANRILT